MRRRPPGRRRPADLCRLGDGGGLLRRLCLHCCLHHRRQRCRRRRCGRCQPRRCLCLGRRRHRIHHRRLRLRRTRRSRRLLRRHRGCRLKLEPPQTRFRLFPHRTARARPFRLRWPGNGSLYSSPMSPQDSPPRSRVAGGDCRPPCRIPLLLPPSLPPTGAVRSRHVSG